MKKETITKIIVALVTVIAVGIVIAFPIKWLWNWLMPNIFGLMELTFYQALGLNVLIGFLFNGIKSTS